MRLHVLRMFAFYVFRGRSSQMTILSAQFVHLLLHTVSFSAVSMDARVRQVTDKTDTASVVHANIFN